jgi:LPXTG-site transpeptidase (sortase) family protein
VLTPLNSGIDTAIDFIVAATGGDDGRDNDGRDNDGKDNDDTGGNHTRALPSTGFAPNVVTLLPSQPAELAYTKMSDLWLEIPSLKVKANIVGVPQSENAWDVKWLGQDAGWLDGTAFPTWAGNSVITGHVTDSNGKPGPFVNIKDLKYGDQVIVHLFDGQYIFEVRNKRLVRPDATDFAFEHLEKNSYLTLITCQSYDAATDSYRLRRVVRAVLVGVK